MNFLARSAKRFQQQAAQILDANPTPSVNAPLSLFTFPADVDKMIVGSDADYKSTSTSTVSCTPRTENGESFLRFSGKTAGDGYAAMRSKVEPSSFYGVPTTDVSPYKFLTLRLRGDARRYFINLQTESYLETDLYQHRVFLTSQGTGTWENVTLKWNDFTLTNNGQIQEKQVAMDKYRLKTVGISVLDRLPGKFELDVQWIRAENDAGASNDNMNDVNSL
ncbi:Complex I intermediate-associated protein 30, mitochondrial [Taphrina deformans PYCC 5710]|uniref:Complex I intermediate-associated protein 30, mitochondrial n=1 Tax=Taphrina deformans (strain PYCC 5710 / ATCC 11124 / CBS 356.35 / IMI 108563 / JCM 9778 / NBRC 8474) TaxID=1097556 RepID=R4XFN1_TAPDE|nr:Complex I intermediate-associated protein 30, mitochondrial [Taphrina deformans PYCC 5710]|eukprot:CCG82157.1 Complex I intermediate-associated protein 30, mitochondrial [Taphrina deformans PYCC 5710]